MNKTHLLPEIKELESMILSVNRNESLSSILNEALLFPLENFFSAGGKNLRAKLTKLGYQLSTDIEPDHFIQNNDKLEIASSIIEMIHSGSLIVDDIQDGSSTRRNVPALHVQHGMPLALNAGNWLYFWAMALLPKLNLDLDESLNLQKNILEIMIKAHSGQAIDLCGKIDSIPRENVKSTSLISMELKTGALISLCFILGAAAGKRSASVELKLLGLKSGIILQIYDDIGNFLNPNDPKHYEDVKLRRPGWIWAMASTLPEKDFKIFKEITTPENFNERLIKLWIKHTDFKNLILHEARKETHQLIQWVKTNRKESHPNTSNELISFLEGMEKTYVTTI